MMAVERQLPRNSRIMRLVKAAAMTPSLTTPEIAPFTNRDWSLSGTIWKSGGRICFSRGRSFFTPWMIAKVEAEPFFRIVVRTARLPFTCTMLCCGGAPSST